MNIKTVLLNAADLLQAQPHLWKDEPHDPCKEQGCAGEHECVPGS